MDVEVEQIAKRTGEEQPSQASGKDQWYGSGMKCAMSKPKDSTYQTARNNPKSKREQPSPQQQTTASNIKNTAKSDLQTAEQIVHQQTMASSNPPQGKTIPDFGKQGIDGKCPGHGGGIG